MKCYCVVNFRESLQMLETETPTPTGAQVLVQVRAAGVCHSDIHFWEGGYDLGNGKTLSLKDRGIKLPMTTDTKRPEPSLQWDLMPKA